MGRQKEEVGLKELAPESAVSLAEHEALRARLADVEAQLMAERRKAAQTALDVEPGAVGDYWRVELFGAPTHVVRAPDAANAWEKYRAELGVLGSEQRPSITPSDRAAWHQAQARRHNRKPEEFTPAE